MSPLTIQQLSNTNKKTLSKSDINDVIRSNHTINAQTVDTCNVLQITEQHEKETQIIPNENNIDKKEVDENKIKWLAQLKKRGPRLRQPTISIANYTTEQLSAHEAYTKNEKIEDINKEKDDMIIKTNQSSKTVEVEENATIKNDKRIWLEERKKRGPRQRQPTMSIFNYQDIKNHKSEQNVLEHTATIAVNLEKKVLKDKISKRQDIEGIYLTNNDIKNSPAQILNSESKKLDATAINDTLAKNVNIKNIVIENNVEVDINLRNKDIKNIITIVESNGNDQINLGHIPNTSKVFNLINFYSDIDKKTKQCLLSKENVKNLKKTNDQIFHKLKKERLEREKMREKTIEQDKVEEKLVNIPEIKKLHERTFQFKDLVAKWSK